MGLVRIALGGLRGTTLPRRLCADRLVLRTNEGPKQKFFRDCEIRGDGTSGVFLLAAVWGLCCVCRTQSSRSLGAAQVTETGKSSRGRRPHSAGVSGMRNLLPEYSGHVTTIIPPRSTGPTATSGLQDPTCKIGS